VRLRALVLPAAITVSAISISACSSQSGTSLAREACAKVHSSVAAYEASKSAPNPATRSRDLRIATNDLTQAEPLAAAATSSDGQWNALMTTLNEFGQVDELHLIPALRAQCAVANSSNPEIPNTPTTFPPVPTSAGPG
jgi:hypothetical protein